MNSKKTPPYYKEIHKVLLDYSEEAFTKAISKISKKDLPYLRIEVYPEGVGKLPNILEAKLPAEEFDILASKAKTMLFEGPLGTLKEIGVM